MLGLFIEILYDINITWIINLHKIKGVIKESNMDYINVAVYDRGFIADTNKQSSLILNTFLT